VDVESKNSSAVIWAALIASIVLVAVGAFVYLFRTPVAAPSKSASIIGEEPREARIADTSRPTPPSEPSKPEAASVPPPVPLAPVAAPSPTPAPTPRVSTPMPPEITPLSPLPTIPPGTPPGQAAALLRPYADVGHQKAACLLANTLTPCRLAYDYGIGDSAALCSGITRNDAAQGNGYLLQTGQNGQADAQMVYVMYPPLASAQLASSEESVRLYRDRAPQFLNAGVARGNPTALWIAFTEAAGMGTPGAPSATPRSDYYALVYGTVLTSMITGPIANQVSERLTTIRASAQSNGIDVNRALAEANKMREERFNGKHGLTADALNPKKIDCN
jgi:hypothetical protein